jgi:hypothetical protein
MNAIGTGSEQFLSRAGELLEAAGELLVLLRFHGSAGAKEFRLVTSIDDLQRLLSEQPPRTSVVVIGRRQLPVRGVVDPALIERASREIATGGEWLIVDLFTTTAGKASWWGWSVGESVAELVEELTARIGREVAVGIHPEWLEDGDLVTSAFVPDSDGRVVVGVY